MAADGHLDVVERITARAEGSQIRRGLYRDFPTRYRDRYGNGVVAGFEVVGLQRDGRPEPFFLERLSNGVRVNFGNDDLLPVPAVYSYTLRYRTTRQVGFFDDHDELYWNAIGTGWIFPIDAGRVDVGLPDPVPVGQMQAEVYTGVQGRQEQDYAAQIVGPGRARWDLTAPLAPTEGLTIVLSFPRVCSPNLTRSRSSGGCLPTIAECWSSSADLLGSWCSRSGAGIRWGETRARASSSRATTRPPATRRPS